MYIQTVYTVEVARETPHRVLWDANNRNHLFVEHAARGQTEEEINEVLLDATSIKIADEKHRTTVTVGRTAKGRPILVAWRALRRGMYPVHARQVSLKFWRQINEDIS